MFPETRPFFVSSLVPGSPTEADKPTLYLEDRNQAAFARDFLTKELNDGENTRVLVFDLAGIVFTPASLQELILPLVQRIRGGEYGNFRIVITTPDSGVRDFISYMAEVHHLPLYLAESPFNLRDATPVGAITETEKSTLDTINFLGGHVTASRLAATEGLNPSAAANRLANLDRDGYLLRQPRGRREGDLYIEPRSATTPIISDVSREVNENATNSNWFAWST